jgi:DNA mismatch repair protein MutL
MGKIAILDETIARRIAAGEVIDRPAAVVRELLDNSIDSGARRIAVSIDSGGIDSITVSDDGEGMDAEDLAKCVIDHATSKIASIDDLQRIVTMGFRGEALASIAAVARLKIASKRAEDQAGNELTCVPPGIPEIIRTACAQGTTVEVRGLFDSIPARKRFLKRPQAEAAAIVQVFREKAAAFPAVEFKLRSGDRTDVLLPDGGLSRAVAALTPDLSESLFSELRGNGPFFSWHMVSGDPSLARNDRRHLYIFVNKRRIFDLGLQKAVELAYSGILPGGLFPVATLFLDISPDQVDINVHPAKKEAKIRGSDEIKDSVIRTVREYWKSAFSASPGRFAAPVTTPTIGRSPGASYFDALGIEHSHAAHAAVLETPYAYYSEYKANEAIIDRPASTGTAIISEHPKGYRYHGQLLGVFQAFSSDDEFLLMDQHAAHERILFDTLDHTARGSQRLLIPLIVEIDVDEGSPRLAEIERAMRLVGFAFSRNGSSWEFEALPVGLPQTAGGIIDIVSCGDPNDPERAIRARTACHSAIKDGDQLDPETAIDLFEKAMALPEPRCPHGRPIFQRFSKRDLFKRFGRLIQ